MSLRRRLLPLLTASTVPLVAALTIALGAAPAHAAASAYTALGDSYASGTGSREYYADSGSCRRSKYSYPVLDAARIGATLTHPACHGATVSDVLNKQLGSLNASTSYVTVTVGGNDVDWAGVIVQCALPWPATCWSQIETAKNNIRNTLPGRLDQLYTRIRSLAPNARVVVAGYPRLFNGEECNWIARISPDEQAELNIGADLLATTIKARATAHGFSFVDVRGPFTGHAVCDDVEWLNGTSSPVTESYHPNRSGHAAYADQVGSALGAARSRRS